MKRIMLKPLSRILSLFLALCLVADSASVTGEGSRVSVQPCFAEQALMLRIFSRTSFEPLSSFRHKARDVSVSVFALAREAKHKFGLRSPLTFSTPDWPELRRIKSDDPPNALQRPELLRLSQEIFDDTNPDDLKSKIEGYRKSLHFLIRTGLLPQSGQGDIISVLGGVNMLLFEQVSGYILDKSDYRPKNRVL